MLETLISDHREDHQITPSNNNTSLPISRFSKSESSDSSRKLRIFMNKATDQNFQKLLDDLIQTLTLDEKILSDFTKLVFERAISKSSTELYLDIISYFSHQLKLLNISNYKLLKHAIQCRAQSYTQTQSQKPWGSFVGQLFKEKIVKSKTVLKLISCVDLEEINEELLESLCLLVEVAGPYLCVKNESFVESFFESLGRIVLEKYSKKVQFMVINSLEQKKKTMTAKTGYIPRFTEVKTQKRIGKRVSFIDSKDFSPILKGFTKRILKHTLTEELKSDLKKSVFEYVKCQNDLTRLKGIFELCKSQERQMVYQIIKYSLIQFKESEFSTISELLVKMNEKFLSNCVIETGIAYTVEAIDDIKLDTPLAAFYLKGIIEHLKEKGIISSPEYLFTHLSKPIRKFSDSEFTY